jgi:hypothetical protein
MSKRQVPDPSLKSYQETSESWSPTFHYPKITSRQLIGMYGKERKELFLFLYFGIATNFEPA